MVDFFHNDMNRKKVFMFQNKRTGRLGVKKTNQGQIFLPINF